MLTDPSTQLNPVAVLDGTYAGYGVARCLAPYGIPVAAFYTGQRRPPEMHSRFWRDTVHFGDPADLLARLCAFAEAQDQRPLLMMTADQYVDFFLAHRAELEARFLIHFPATDVAYTLLRKRAFSDYALRNGLRYPRSIHVTGTDDVQRIGGTLEFPVVVKPDQRNFTWLVQGLPKVGVLRNFRELQVFFAGLNDNTGGWIVQEWVPGPTQSLCYCFVYFDAQHRCLATFEGYKEQIWPQETGSASVAVPEENESIRAETVNLFTRLAYAGFGSVEFKRHALNGRYYVMEPTVGRLDQQQYVAALNGVNFPLVAYNALTGAGLEPAPPPRHPVAYVDEWAELRRCCSQLLRRAPIRARGTNHGVKPKRAYRFWNTADMGVFLSSFGQQAGRLPRKVYRKLGGEIRGITRR